MIGQLYANDPLVLVDFTIFMINCNHMKRYKSVLLFLFMILN